MFSWSHPKIPAGEAQGNVPTPSDKTQNSGTPFVEEFSCPVRSRTKIPAHVVQRNFPCPHESSYTSCNLLGQKALAGFLRTSYPRLRSANSARTAWEFAKLPFCCAKPRFLRLGERGVIRPSKSSNARLDLWLPAPRPAPRSYAAASPRLAGRRFRAAKGRGGAEVEALQ